MKQRSRGIKQYAVLLAAVLSLCPLTACSDESAPAESSISAESSENSADTEDSEESQAEESSEESSADAESSEASQADDSSMNAEDSAQPAEDSKPAEESSQKPAESSQAAAKPADPQKPAENSKQPADNKKPAEDSKSDDGEEIKEIKKIYLKGTSAQYNGTGIAVTGSRITISKGGTYEISGELTNGQIYIFAEDKKVRLQLNNCKIHNNAGSAINCQQAKKVTLETLAGTVNTISDGGTHDDDKGAVFSEDTVILEGTGTLNIEGKFAHGVQSDDDIIVNGGTINIQSTKSCLHCNDGIEINGGNLRCDGGTNGIKTDGYVNITGGNSVFLGGNREEKGAVYCDGAFTVTGGSFYALGNTCAKPAAASTACVIGAVFAATQPAETPVKFTCVGKELANITSPRAFKYALYCGSGLAVGNDYNVTYGSTDGGNFHSDSKVTFYNVPLA